MNSRALRPVVAHGAVALGVCAGLHAWLGGWASGELSSARSALAQVEALRAGRTQYAAESPSALGALEERLGEIERRSALAKDQTELFAAYMALAGSCGVRIEQLRPADGLERVVSSTPEEIAAGRAARDGSLKCSLVLTGPYGSVARFVDAVSRTLGHTAVRGMRLTPSVEGGVEHVQAAVEAVHFVLETEDGAPGDGPRGGRTADGTSAGGRP